MQRAPVGATSARRAGSSAITARRASGVMPSQAPISAPVRPQPAQKPVARSMTQSLTQGDSIAGGGR